VITRLHQTAFCAFGQYELGAHFTSVGIEVTFLLIFYLAK